MIAPMLISALFAFQGPQVELWTDRGDGEVYRRGERVRVYFRAEDNAYVTVLRVDTDGRIRVLFPEHPWEDNFARGGRAYEVRPSELRYAFSTDEYPGQGYVFVLATLDPFDYQNIVFDDRWDYRAIANAGRITGDPYVALQDLADLIVPASYQAYGYDLTTYYVEQHYDYPRFLCYDCHSYIAYPSWDPYHYACSRFRIVVYDDPYYYPARVYPANRVVYHRVAKVEPRYVFKDRTPTEPYVVRVRQRQAEPAPRRADERGVTGRDLGGVETVRAPLRGAPTGAGPSGARALTPPRRPDPVSRPLPQPAPERRPVAQPRLPERETPTATNRPRATGATTVPSPERRTPQAVPRTPVPVRPVPAQNRPRLERREPPEATPAGRTQQPAARRPASPAKPQEPPKKPDPPRRRPGT